MERILTIDDVAKAAGVSRSTVSLVLNGRPGLRTATLEGVRQAISSLGYVPTTPGRRPGPRLGATRATNRLALLVPGLPRAQINSPVYMDVLHGVEAATSAANKSFVLNHLTPGALCPGQLFPQKVDGVIVFGPVHDKRLAAKLRAMPCVQVMGRIEREGWWDHVSYDNARLGEIAARHLLERGHRHAALISNSDTAPHLVERGEIFRNAMLAANGTCLELIDNQLLTDTDTIQQVNQPRLAALIDQLFTQNTDRHGQTRTDTDGYDPSHPSPAPAPSPRPSPSSLALVPSPPTAIFLVADTLAPAVCGELLRRGIVVGHDLDIISCNNEQMLLNHLHPRPATIDIHAELVGRKAVEQLLWRIEHPGDPRVATALAPTLVEGEAEEEGKG